MLVWSLVGHGLDMVHVEADMRKVDILPQTDILGFAIYSKWHDSQPKKFKKKNGK